MTKPIDRTRLTFLVSWLMLLVICLGCGKGEYDRRMQTRIQQLRTTASSAESDQDGKTTSEANQAKPNAAKDDEGPPEEAEGGDDDRDAAPEDEADAGNETPDT